VKGLAVPGLEGPLKNKNENAPPHEDQSPSLLLPNADADAAPNRGGLLKERAPPNLTHGPAPVLPNAGADAAPKREGLVVPKAPPKREGLLLAPNADAEDAGWLAPKPPNPPNAPAWVRMRVSVCCVCLGAWVCVWVRGCRCVFKDTCVGRGRHVRGWGGELRLAIRLLNHPNSPVCAQGR